MKRIDERDTMFARMNLKKGTLQYEEYYKRHPELKEIDDELRDMPELCSPDTPTYKPFFSSVADANFNLLSDLRNYCDHKSKKDPISIERDKVTTWLKGLTKYYGAVKVGILKMEDKHYYSHRGRHIDVYGQKVEDIKNFGIVFAVEMKEEMINCAPRVWEVIETSRAYVQAATIGMMLAYFIKELGFNARNHMDGNYLVNLPSVAYEAGLGEIGRNNLLVTKEYGPRIRLGIVTTDMELIADSKENFGLKEFCKYCGKCSKNCPGRALIQNNNEEIKWKLNQEECYRRWRALGTDCGICIASCPFSHNINLDKINEMKDNKEIIIKIIKDYNKEYPNRPYSSDDPEWIR